MPNIIFLSHLVSNLRNSRWIERLLARHVLIKLGGEVASDLATLDLGQTKETIIWLLTSIEQETARQFAWRKDRLRCPNCLTRFGRHSVRLSLALSFSYYGCRACGQSRKFIPCGAGVIAVLDPTWQSEPYQLQDGLLRVNWLARRELFDFNQVEINRAGDEDVERFTVQVGNDTDSVRKLRYKQMRCNLGPEAQLSENTLRILESIFGRVERIGALISQ